MTEFGYVNYFIAPLIESSTMPQVFMIGGPNGSGKTTCAMDLMPSLLECEEYVNADAIAAGLSPFRPETTAMQAGRLMLDRIHQLALLKKDFAFETTMASKNFVPFLKDCQLAGYSVNMLFLWVESVELAIGRVADRVLLGGHAIPETTIRRRYLRGIQNFFMLYKELADSWAVYDNSTIGPLLIAKGEKRETLVVNQQSIWKELLELSR